MPKKIKTKVKKLGKSQIPKIVVSKLKRGCWTCEEYGRRIQEERTQKQQPIINFPSQLSIKIINDEKPTVISIPQQQEKPKVSLSTQTEERPKISFSTQTEERSKISFSTQTEERPKISFSTQTEERPKISFSTQTEEQEKPVTRSIKTQTPQIKKKSKLIIEEEEELPKVSLSTQTEEQPKISFSTQTEEQEKPVTRSIETQTSKTKKQTPQKANFLVEEEEEETVFQPAPAGRTGIPNKETIKLIEEAYGLDEGEAIGFYYGQRDMGVSSNDIRKELEKMIKEKVGSGEMSVMKEKGGIRYIMTPSRMETFKARTEQPTQQNIQTEEEQTFIMNKPK